jgi:hypothetical protein
VGDAHELANLFPMFGAVEFQALCDERYQFRAFNTAKHSSIIYSAPSGTDETLYF